MALRHAHIHSLVVPFTCAYGVLSINVVKASMELEELCIKTSSLKLCKRTPYNQKNIELVVIASGASLWIDVL
jgi:hypothetical protein